MVLSRLAPGPLILIALASAHCGADQATGTGQLVLFIDTDAPSASRSLVDTRLADASVDTLRIDVLNAENEVVSWREISAPDEAYWPVSFGIQSQPGTTVTRLRLRAFRAKNAEIGTASDHNAYFYEPLPTYTIDRVLELPLPQSEGAFAYRVVLRAACRGVLPDFVGDETCVDAQTPSGSFRQGIEPLGDVAVPPAREPAWQPWADRPACTKRACPGKSVCVPAGYFMLGNARVVGFESMQRTDAVPAHPVLMEPFCMDATEVSVSDYAAVTEPGEYQPRSSELCSWNSASQDGPKPMNCLSWQQAQDACNRRGGRLPTEAEWEYAATGQGAGNLFPWGNAPPTCDTAVLERHSPLNLDAYCSSDDKLEPVEQSLSLGDKVLGIAGLGGSVSEWMADDFRLYDDGCWQREGILHHPLCKAANGLAKAVRGGSFDAPREVSYAALRFGETADTQKTSIGFRCVYPLKGGTDPAQALTEPESSSGNVEEPNR